MVRKSLVQGLKSDKPIHPNEVLEKFRILLPGVPAKSNRGWFGYCTVVLFPLRIGWALFDTGHYSDRDILLAALKAVGVDPEEIRHVVLSHLHFDHVLNLPLFRKASITISQAELNYASDVTAGRVEDFAVPDFWPALLKGRDIRIVEDTLVLEEGIEVVTMPGHTPGCLVMFCEEPVPTAVCGDVVKNAWEAVTGEATSACVDKHSIRESITKVLKRAEIIIPGHDRPFVLRDDGLDYLTAVTWKVHGNFFPGPLNETLLDLSTQEGVCRKL
ncbi:MAG: MBL fold metallo-hydrolase [Syntrophaceae bacterium]|nr:MBL fold metallo-hydrolase [Syntrophaceae bacterium]